MKTCGRRHEKKRKRAHVPLEVPGHGDLAVDQGLHHPADHLVQRARHVLAELPLEAALHVLPEDHTGHTGM